MYPNPTEAAGREEREMLTCSHYAASSFDAAAAAFAALAHILLAVTVIHQSESGEVESE